MKRLLIIGVIIAVFILIGSLFYTGIIPGLGVLDNDTNTISKTHICIKGNGRSELLDKKGYILSYKNDEFSEKISIIGQLQKTGSDCAHCGFLYEKVRYLVYLKLDSSHEYELMSSPGDTKRYFSNPNPGEMYKPALGCWKDNAGNPRDDGYQRPYDFYLVGNDYSNGAIKAVIQCKLDLSMWDDKGSKWYTMAIDEAFLYSGYGGLHLPRGLEDELDKPYSTFEVGQTVKIGVETAKGGQTGDNQNWRVTLNKPYSGNIDSPEDGTVVVSQNFPDDCDPSNTFFEFTVTDEMARQSMSNSYPYTVRIWNTLLPKGSLQIDFVDFVAGCPSDVDFVGSIKVKVGETTTVDLSATVSSGSSASIDYFRVAVIYGTNDALLPGDHSSSLWIIHTTPVGNDDSKACGVPQTIQFKADREEFVTVHAKAFDTDGRGSKTTRTFTMKIWGESGEPPDETIADETGDADYGGGHTSGWHPWDPSEGTWEQGLPIKIDTTGVIIAIVILAIFALIALLIPNLNQYIRFAIILVGVAIAIIQYLLFFIS